ncbi:MAG: OmpA family protein, partial [Prevotellaceae bacterium]|nr:OmpA family protein [Prevotellaceae bacterium]
MKRFLILLIAVLSFSAFDLQAQVVNLKGKIILKDRNGVVDARGGEGAYVFIFNTAEDAKDFISEYKNSPTGVIRAQHVAADHNGEFSCSVLSGGHLVIYNPSTKKDPINHTVKSSDEGRKLEFTFADDGITLQGVDVNAKKILTSGPKARKARGFGKYLTWTCDNMLVANQANHDSRLVVQPYAIDCQTEDTIQLMPAFVIEGDEYHNIQRRRMDYDYDKNDSVANYFIDTLTVSKDELMFTKTLVFEKPDPNRSYYCTAKMWLEDYSHVYWETEGEFGSCFVSNPFKFMNFKLSGGEMPLDPDEFFEVPTSELRENNKSLQIQFPINRSEMADTEANQQQMEALLRDLHSYGNRLAQVRVIGYASPDGNYERNQKLAADRAQSVMQVIRRSVDSRKVQLPSGQAVVCTWDDVADSLVARGFVTDAEELRGYAKEGGSVMAKVKNMIIFDTVIDQILQNQRKMYCSYMYSLNSQLTPEDAVRYYRTNPAYGEGGTYRFSHGDWFNIIANTTDSLEQKKIIDRVYKEITTTESGYEYNAFAAYIANRKALDVIRSGEADTTILKPFIDYAAGANVTKPISYFNKSTYVINRPAILANQAIMYMRLGDSPMAEFLVNKLTGDEPIKKEVGSYVEMMNWVLRLDDPALTDEEREKGKAGFDFVCEQDPVNNAILKAELYDDLGYDRTYVTDLVKNNLKDEDARKWYLLGVLKSKDALVDNDDDADRKDDQPEFVGLMEKAIEMNPAYARYYASEANISKEVFERYPIKSAPKATKQNVNSQPISIGNGLEQYKLEHRWRPQDAPFSNKFFDHMWVELGAGLEMSHQRSSDTQNKIRPIADFYVGIGKQLHPFHSIRLTTQLGYTRRMKQIVNYMNFGARLDYMFSISQYVNGYNPDRVFDVSAVTGAGMTFSKVDYSGFFSSPEAYLGVNMKIKTGPYGYLSIEPFLSLRRDVYDLAQGWSKFDVTHGLNVTYLSYLNSNNTFDRPSVKTQKWRAPWFVEAGNAITTLSKTKTMSNPIKPGHDITASIGKWFSPMLGVRAGVTAITDIDRVTDNYNYHRTFAGIRADALFNPLGGSK